VVSVAGQSPVHLNKPIREYGLKRKGSQIETKAKIHVH